MSDRMCIDCQLVPVPGRRRLRCEGCRKAHRAKVMRQRRAAESGHELDDHARSEDEDVEVVDYTQGGYSVPRRDIRPQQAPRRPDPEPQDPRVESPATRGRRQYDLSKIPASVRQDRVRFEQAKARQHADDEFGRSEWDTTLQELSAKFGMQGLKPYVHDVVFERPGEQLPSMGRNPMYQPRQARVDYLGRSIPRQRWS